MLVVLFVFSCYLGYIKTSNTVLLDYVFCYKSMCVLLYCGKSQVLATVNGNTVYDDLTILNVYSTKLLFVYDYQCIPKAYAKIICIQLTR